MSENSIKNFVESLQKPKFLTAVLLAVATLICYLNLPLIDLGAGIISYNFSAGELAKTSWVSGIGSLLLYAPAILGSLSILGFVLSKKALARNAAIWGAISVPCVFFIVLEFWSRMMNDSFFLDFLSLGEVLSSIGSSVYVSIALFIAVAYLAGQVFVTSGNCYKVCSHCNKTFFSGSNFCPNCGSPLQSLDKHESAQVAAFKVCKSCNTRNPKENTHCSLCGNELL